jgi:hypothetical protein
MGRWRILVRVLLLAHVAGGTEVRNKEKMATDSMRWDEFKRVTVVFAVVPSAS